MTQDRASASGLLRRLGLAGEPADLRFGWRVVFVVLAIYVLSFALFYPQVPTNHDEANYIRQAYLVLQGGGEISQIDAFSGEPEPVVLATYPLGTAMLMAPFYAAFGERGVFVVPCLAAVCAVLFTALWIATEKRSPVFALAMLGFPALLVLGRVAMSDVPSAACVALGLWLFWRGIDRGPGWWLASGFAAGASLSLRATNPVMFVPLFAGAVLRRESKAAWLVFGGLAGLGVRLASQQFYYGNALYERASSYPISLGTIDERLLLYLLGVLVFVPGGLFFSMAYRGRRRPEIVITSAIFFLLYLLQRNSTIDTSQSKRLILALRYLIPLLPLMAFAMAEAVPRLWNRWMATATPGNGDRLRLVAGTLLVVWLGGLGLASAAVHPVFSTWSSGQAELRKAIGEHVPADAVMLANTHGTKKFTRELDRKFRTLNTVDVGADRIPELVREHDRVYLVLMDRNDSAAWKRHSKRNADYLAAVPIPPELIADVRPTEADRLRIWRLGELNE